MRYVTVLTCYVVDECIFTLLFQLYNASKDFPVRSFDPTTQTFSYTTGPLEHGRVYNVSIAALNLENQTGELNESLTAR